jgi:hypothetical protein
MYHSDVLIDLEDIQAMVQQSDALVLIFSYS